MKKFLLALFACVSVSAAVRYTPPNFDTNTGILYPYNLKNPLTPTGGDTMRPIQDWLTNRTDVTAYGAVGDATTDCTTFFAKALTNTLAGGTLYVPAGSYVLDSLVITQNVKIELHSAARLLHKANSTNDMITMSTAQIGRLRGGILDGNKANQVLTNTASRKTLLVVNFADFIVEDVTFTNYVYSGIKSTNGTGILKLIDCNFINGAEHSGTAGGVSTAVNLFYHSSGLSNISPRLTVTRCLFEQTAAPSAAGKSPGGVYVHGLDSASVYPETTVSSCIFRNMGQSYTGNFIGNIDCYEDNRNVRVTGNTFEGAYYVPIKIQNSTQIQVQGNKISGTTNLTTHCIWLDFAERTDTNIIGDAVVSENFIYDAVNAEAIVLQGVNAPGKDIIVANNRIKNCKGGIVFQGAQGMQGSAIVVGNIVEAVGSGYSALGFGNFAGIAQVCNNSFFGGGSGTGHALIASTGLTNATMNFANNYFETYTSGLFPFALFGVSNITMKGNVFNNTPGGVAVRFGTNSLGATVGRLMYSSDNVILNGTLTMPPTHISSFIGTFVGLVTPESNYAAPVGTLCIYSGAVWRKESGTGNTGWKKQLSTADVDTQGELETLIGVTLATDTELAAGLAGKSDTNHVHSGADITSGTVVAARIDTAMATDAELTSGLAGKANTSHTHAGEDITSGTVAAARIDSAMATDAEVAATYLAKAGLPMFMCAVSDETTELAAGNNKITFRAPRAFTVTAVRASVNTVSSSGVVDVDINEGGVSIFSTRLTIDASEKTSTTAATPAVVSDTSIADDAEITIDIEAAGTGAKGLKVYIYGTP